MALQTSGAITLAEIQTEFGGANPISMSEYYAGGAYVPSGTTGTNGAVPTSGQISFSQFYGTSDFVMPTITLGNHTLTAYSDSVDPTSSTLYFIINSSGMSVASYGTTEPSGGSLEIDTVYVGSAADYNIEQWLDGGLNSDVSVYVTQTSGSTLVPGSDSLATYLNMATTRQFGLAVTRSTLGTASKAATLSVSFVQASNTANVLDTATINLSLAVTLTT